MLCVAIATNSGFEPLVYVIRQDDVMMPAFLRLDEVHVDHRAVNYAWSVQAKDVGKAFLGLPHERSMNFMTGPGRQTVL
jgi:hypothetical protein